MPRSFTHDHADHLFGLDDLRIFSYYLGGPMPVYCEAHVEQRIRKSFDYAFTPEAKNYGGGVPQIVFHTIAPGPFEVLGQPITALRLQHGRFEVLGFRIGNVAYCTDTNAIPPESWSLLAGLDLLVLDALRPQPHATHFSLDEAVAVATHLGAKQTLLTHLSHELEHEATAAGLPPGIALAYDGLRAAADVKLRCCLARPMRNAPGGGVCGTFATIRAAQGDRLTGPGGQPDRSVRPWRGSVRPAAPGCSRA